MDPVSILPPEVWELIMTRLPTHKEKLNAYNTCSLWMSFLEKKRTLWMFQGIFPSLFNYLPKSDILKSRLICKSWNGVIESYLESDQSFMLSPGYHHVFTGRVMPFRSFQVDFQISGNRLGLSSKQALKRFEEEFTTEDGDALCNKNPIVSRSIELTLEVDFEALTFFEIFGAHLWYLKLNVFQQPLHGISSPLQTVRYIWNILALVPNLKKLVVSVGAHNLCEDEIQMKVVEQFLTSYPAPPLPHLSDLQMDTDIILMRKYLETLYFPQLTKYVHTEGPSFMQINPGNLIDVAWVFSETGAESQLNNFRNLGTPTLQRLHIYVLNCDGDQEDNIPTASILFEAMETSMRSLTHLSLYWRYFKGTFPEDLDLPCIQELSLEIKSCDTPKNINFSFLRTLKSLRKLKCIFWEDCYFQLYMLNSKSRKENHYTATESVDLHQYFVEYGPPKSNIWHIIPSLDVIEIEIISDPFAVPRTECIVHTRADME